MVTKAFTTREKLHVETWQLPRLDGKVVNEPEQDTPAEPEEEELLPPSAAELQAIRDAAREEGFTEGVSLGHTAGVEQGHEEGFQEGFEAGKLAGEQAGREAAEAQALKELGEAKADFANRFSAILNQLNTAEAALEDELTPVVRDLILRIAQSLVVESLRHTPEQIEQIVHQAIQLVPVAHERMDISLHPDDYAILTEIDRPWLEHVALHADATLSPGGCVIKTRHSLLDYTLQARYEQQIAALLDLDRTELSEPLRTLTAERFKALTEVEPEVETEPAAPDDALDVEPFSQISSEDSLADSDATHVEAEPSTQTDTPQSDSELGEDEPSDDERNEQQ
ncbi:FliH/SctL family protein [Salinispirillum sp. LH 10-3-1]|uniref:Flagellar assembly protein FliH n=1 Tax=Salinispirillum sp. LH 10-3-1 TaxID=2952525 RepID=A0AB38YCM9_9GAMM